MNLAKVADEHEWSRAASAIELVSARGFDRGRDLRAGLEELRAVWRDE